MLREISHLADGADFAIKPVSFSTPRHEINNTFDVDTTFKRFSSAFIAPTYCAKYRTRKMP